MAEERYRSRVHLEHRKRVKAKFLANGAESFTDDELLELFLFYAIPQGDVMDTVYALGNELGSLDAIFDADPCQLMRVKGIGEHAAIHFAMTKELLRRYLLSRNDPGQIIGKTADAGAYLSPYFFGANREMLYLMALDGKNKVLYCGRVADGNRDSVLLDPERIVRAALDHRAVGVILAHNHPNGVGLPSLEDQLATKQAARALNAVRVRLIDHLILTDDDFVSFRDSGLLDGI